ncbi:MAG: TonB-dependent hemoglobin/transferrin/lactoferrin family receptor [Gammaproteobacteria bacterium]
MNASRLLWAALFSSACGADPGVSVTESEIPALAANVDGAATGFSVLPDLVVIAAGRPQPTAEVVGDVSVIDRSEIERLQAQDLRDLVRYEPGVAVVNDPARFGADSFNIRGLQGNRVGIEIDGVPLPDGFAIGLLSNAGRDLIDPELVRRVEILRGPASTLYGSDALGGVVSFTTRDPFDLARPEDAYAGVLATYTTRDAAMRTGLLGAWQGEGLGALALYSKRNGHETENHARDDELDANPADVERDSGFLKLTAEHPVGRAALTLERYATDAQTDVRSLLGSGRFVATESLQSDDSDERERALVSLEFDRAGWLADEVELRGYAQRARADQHVIERRRAQPPIAPFALLRERDFQFQAEQLGVEADLRREFAAWGLRHQLVYGFEASRTDYEEERDGRQTNLVTGTVTNVILGEDLPVRDFPNSTAEEWALFLTDEVTLPNPRWAVIGGLRYDHYSVDAEVDELFREDNPDVAPANLSDSSLTPKLGVRYAVSDADHVYAAYVQGFRAPPFSDVNIALVLPLFNYVVLANPDLEPERSQGVELGWNHSGERAWWRLVGYYNHYEDLIESRANLGVDATGATVFQSVNRDRARIFGVEAAAGASLASLHPGLRGVSVHGAFAWSQGDDLERDEPLNTVLPARLVVGIEREARGGWPELGAVLTAVSEKGRVDRSTANLFEPPGYVTLDLRARLRFDRYASLDVGIYNVFDQRYWDWASLRGVTEDNVPSPGFFTEPGRNAALTLRIGW